MTATTIHLRFADRDAALVALAPLGLVTADAETGATDLLSTAWPGGVRVDLALLGGDGVYRRVVGTETLDVPDLGTIEVPVMEVAPGFHLDLLWSGGTSPDFGAAEIHPDTPSAVFAASETAPVVATVPASVSRFQARAALREAGLIDQIEAVIGSADEITQEAWASAISFERSSPTIATLAATLGLADTQVDDLFRRAAQITA